MIIDVIEIANVSVETHIAIIFIIGLLGLTLMTFTKVKHCPYCGKPKDSCNCIK